MARGQPSPTPDSTIGTRGAPTFRNLVPGSPEGLFDRSYYPCLEKTQGPPYGLYVRAGQGGTGTRRGVERLTRG